MTEPPGAAEPSIPPAVIGQITAAAAQFAARHEEPSPASIMAVATTRAQALDVVFKGTRMPGTETVPVYAVVMTGRFASYRGGMRAHPPHEHLPHAGAALVVVFDAETLHPTDFRLGDHSDLVLLSRLGPVITLKTR